MSIFRGNRLVKADSKLTRLIKENVKIWMSHMIHLTPSHDALIQQKRLSPRLRKRTILAVGREEIGYIY